MKMKIKCGNCKKILNIPDNSGGKKYRCPDCHYILRIPEEKNIGKNNPPPLPKKQSDPPPLPESKKKDGNNFKSSGMKKETLNDSSKERGKETTEDNKLILAIDFGSSRTKIAYFNKDSSKAELLEFGREVRNILPSIFYIPAEGGDLLIGDDAQDMVDTDPQGIVINLKTEIHRTGKKRCGPGRLKIERIELLAGLFAFIKHKSESEVFYNQEISSCTLTVPVCFENLKRECIKKAAELAGFTEIKLMEEPIAAARHWLATAKGDVPNEIIICDVGGGTTDLAILQYKNGKFISYPDVPPAGILQGGNDVDDAIWEQILEQYQNVEQVQSLLAGFLLKIRKIKETLKKYAKSVIPISVAGSEMGVSKEIIEQTIADFVGLVQEEVKAFATKCQSSTGENNIPILLVGGASRLDGLKEAVEEISDGDVYLWKDSDYATVLGAAYDDSSLKKDKSVTDDVIAKDIILCPKCELPNKKQNKFCSSCGESLTKPCPECSHELSIYANNCTSCGTDIKNFLLVQNLLPELKKLTTLNLWNEIILKTDFLPDKLLLKGQKGKKLLKSLNNYYDKAESTIQEISDLDNDIKKKMKQRKFVDALQIFKKLAEISPDSDENNVLNKKLSTLAEFDIFTTDIASKMKSKLNLGSYTEVLKLRDKLNVYLEAFKAFNKKIKESELDFDNANLQLFLDQISKTVASAEKRINSFEEKYSKGATAYRKGYYKQSISCLKEALAIYPLSSKRPQLKQLLTKSQIALHKGKIIGAVIAVVVVIVLIIAIFIGVEISKKNKISELNKKSRKFIAIAESYSARGAWQKSCDNYESAAQVKGHGHCLDNLGYTEALYQAGLAAKNETSAFLYFKKAAERDHAEAQNMTGMAYLEGRGVTKNASQAKQWFEKAANKGLPVAMNNLAFCLYVNGKIYREAARWYEKAKHAGYKISYRDLAECYYWSGKYQDAITYFKKAISNNEMILFTHFAHSYELTKNYNEAIKWYKKSTCSTPGWIQYHAGLCYLKVGETAFALEAFAYAANQGSSDAANKLGDINFHGTGVTKNHRLALNWYFKAAQKGNANAQGQVGWYYLRGQVVEKNYTEALKWIKKSANQRDKWGQRWLGECYEYGYGVKKNLRQAFGYYKASAINRGLKELKLSFGYTDGVFNDDLIIYNNDNFTWTNVYVFVEREFGDKNRYASKYASYKELKQNGRIKYVNLWSSVAEVAIKKKVQFSIICDQGYFFKTYTAHTGVLNKSSNWRKTSRF